KPRRAAGRPDGGIADAAQDHAVAAVTSWSRVRGYRSVCAVPLDGVAPTDASVHARTYPEAYPIRFAVLRKRQRDAYSRKLRKAYVKFLRSSRAQRLFEERGLLMAAKAPPSATPGG